MNSHHLNAISFIKLLMIALSVQVNADKIRRLGSTMTSGDLSNGFYFQLRLHWEEGIVWQQYKKSRAWCATCSGYFCDVGDFVMITKCLEHMDDQKWIFYDDGRIKPLINSDACITTDRGIEGYVRLETCRDQHDDYQRFQLFDDNNIFNKFQIHPRRDDRLCLTQDHHPKVIEEILSSQHAIVF